MVCCGFIDILGTRDAAAHSVDEVRKLLDWFHSALYDHFESHFPEGECMAFSDGAFFKIPEYEAFYEYYRRIRNQLFERGVFFKCSLVIGDIKVIDRETKYDGTYEASSPPRFRSFNFSEDAAKAYLAENHLKGAGCSIEPKAMKGNKRDNIIANFFITKSGNKVHLERFFDYKFSEYEVSNLPETEKEWATEHKILDQIFYNCHLTLIISERDAAKYVSPLVNAIRSSNFSKLKYENNRWIDAPYIFEMLIVNKSSLKAISKLPGLKFVLLSLYDQYSSDTSGKVDQDAETEIIRVLTKRRGYLNNLGEVPEFVLTQKNKRTLAKGVAKLQGLSNTL